MSTRKERMKVECDRCGFTFREGDLTEQRGVQVCSRCHDDPSFEDEQEDED